MALVLPFTLAEDTDADATQVMANFEVLREAVEGVSFAAAASDVYQRGVVSATDFVVGGVTFSVNAGNGELTFNISNGAAWLPTEAGALVRVFTAAATYKIKPPTLPASGGWRKIGIEITASGESTVVSMVSGTEQVSETLAIANPPAITAGKARIFDYVLQNSAGTYSTHAGRDRRSWARGALSQRVLAAGLETKNTTGVTVAELTTRIEATGVPVRVSISGTYLNLESPAKVNVAFGTSTFSTRLFTTTTLAVGAAPVDQSVVFTPAAGSTLAFVNLFAAPGGGAVELAKGTELLIEELRPSANNGTA